MSILILGTKPFTFDSSAGKSNLGTSSMFTFGQKDPPDSTSMKSTPSSTFTFGKAEAPEGNTSLFTFGKTTSTQEAPKADAPFSFNAPNTNKSSTTSPLQTLSSTSSPFSFVNQENKTKESAPFSFGSGNANANKPSGGIFNFGGTNTTNTNQGMGTAPKRADTAPTAPFQFSASTSLQPSVPQKSFSFGTSTTSNPLDPFKFGTPSGGGTSTNLSNQPGFAAAKPTPAFGAASSTSPFGSTIATSKPATATASLFQFGQSGSNPSSQPNAGSNSNAGIFSFGSGGTSSSTTPFGSSSQQAAPAFGSTNTGSAAGNTSSSTGFNFAANANTTVPGVFQFGTASPQGNQPGAANPPGFSFGPALANAPGFPSTSSLAMGQPGAPPGTNMFSIGSSGTSANTKGRTFRTATRRRQK